MSPLAAFFFFLTLSCPRNLLPICMAEFFISFKISNWHMSLERRDGPIPKAYLVTGSELSSYLGHFLCLKLERTPLIGSLLSPSLAFTGLADCGHTKTSVSRREGSVTVFTPGPVNSSALTLKTFPKLVQRS